MDETSVALIAKALDGLALRAIVTADNIANAGTQGYRPMAVSFEGALKAAAGEGVRAIRDVAPRLERAPPVASGEQLRVDLELATASGTALRYAALLDVLGRQMQLGRTAVTGGR